MLKHREEEPPPRAEFLQDDTLQTIRWLRVIGDTIFAIGAFGFGWFVLNQAPMVDTH